MCCEGGVDGEEREWLTVYIFNINMYSLFPSPIIIEEPLDGVATHFAWVTRKNHGNVFSLLWDWKSSYIYIFSRCLIELEVGWRGRRENG